MKQRAYEYTHIVSLEDTNLAGNVYFTKHISWQGRCRELFLNEHAPSVLRDLSGDLALITTRCSCSYFAELFPFDSIMLKMTLAEISPSCLTLLFEYYRMTDSDEELVARGEQEIVCMKRQAGKLEPVAIPEELVSALEPYR